MEIKRNLKQRLKWKNDIFKDVKHENGRYFQYSPILCCLGNFLLQSVRLVLITGLPCPGCGMTRAFIRLLHLDFAGAWQMHPFVYLYAFLFCGSEYEDIYWEFLIQKAWKILAMLGILMILFYIWRMLRYFPGNPPMSYYYGNVLLNLHHIIKKLLTNLERWK